eukprot:Hpha_TRINITY_DN15635_c2_g3::TRINITY_DN15635_c2_g3_i1::g.101880::m.101880
MATASRSSDSRPSTPCDFDQLPSPALAGVTNHGGELPPLDSQQVHWRVILEHPAVAQHHDLVVVHDCLQTMSDSEDGAVTEGLRHSLLDEGVGFDIDGCGHLVHEKELRFAEQRAGEAHKLPLANGEVLPTLNDGHVQPVVSLLEDVPQVGLLQGIPDGPVGVHGIGVEVGAQSAGEEHRVLRNDTHTRPQVREPHRRDVDLVEDNTPLVGLKDAEEPQHHRRLSAPRPPHDPNLLTVAHREVNPTQHVRQVGTVPQVQVMNFHSGALPQPAEGRAGARDDQRSLNRNVITVLLDALHGVHLALQTGNTGHRHLQHHGNLHRVGERKTDQTRGQLRVNNNHDGCQEQHRTTDELQTNAQPPTNVESSPVRSVELVQVFLVLADELLRQAIGADRLHSVQTLSKVRVDGGRGDGHHTVELAGSGTVVLHHHVVH